MIFSPRLDQTKAHVYASIDADEKKKGTQTLAIVQNKETQAWLVEKADKTLTMGCDIEGCPKVDSGQLKTFLKWFAKDCAAHHPW